MVSAQKSVGNRVVRSGTHPSEAGPVFCCVRVLVRYDTKKPAADAHDDLQATGDRERVLGWRLFHR